MASDNKLDLVLNDVVQTGQFWLGGRGMLIAEATWGGGSVKLQFKSPNGTWMDYASGSLSANGALMFELHPCEIRAVVTTATGVYAYAIGTRIGSC